MRVRLIGSRAILSEIETAGEILQTRFDVVAEIYSLTSGNEPARDAKSYVASQPEAGVTTLTTRIALRLIAFAH